MSEFKICHILFSFVNRKSAAAFCWFPLIYTQFTLPFIATTLTQAHINYIHLTLQYLVISLQDSTIPKPCIILKHSFHHNMPLLNIFPRFPNTDLPVQALFSAQSLHLCLVLFHTGNIIHPNPNYTSWFMWMDSIMTLIQTDLSSQLLEHFLYLLNNQALAVQLIHETISL